MFTVWALSSAILAVAAASLLDSNAAVILAHVLFVIAAFSAVRVVVRVTKDMLAPPVVIVFLWLTRYGVSALLGSSGEWREVPFFQAMGLDEQAWTDGLLLAESALLAFLLGWWLGKPSTSRLLAHISRPSVEGKLITFLVLGVGAVSIMAFVSQSVSLEDAIVSGTFRGAVVQEGSGGFFYVGLLAISAATILTSWWLGRGSKPMWPAFLPLVFAAMCFWTLGGRARALTPIAIGLVLGWNHRWSLRNHHPSLRWRVAVGFAMILAIAVWVGTAGKLYRGGYGSSAPGEAIVQLREASSWRETFFTDIGHLHALAGATLLPPGTLHGQTFIKASIFPLSKLIATEGRSPGILIAENALGPFTERRWGLHSSLAGDAYLDFGLVGVFVTAGLFGWALKASYRRFREGVQHPAIFAASYVYAVRIYFESVEKWGEALIVVGSIWLIIKAAESRVVKESHPT